MFGLFIFFIYSDSTCITPVLNPSSPTASQRSSLSITTPNSITTITDFLTPRSSLTSNTYENSTATEFYSCSTDSEDLNATVTNTVNSFFETCREGSARLLSHRRLFEVTRSVRQRLIPLRRASSDFLDKFRLLRKLSIVSTSQIDIPSDQATSPQDSCSCKSGNCMNEFDGNCMKSYMEYRSSPRKMTTTPFITKDVYDHSIFNVARIKKVELHDLTPKVPEFHGKFFLLICIPLFLFYFYTHTHTHANKSVYL